MNFDTTKESFGVKLIDLERSLRRFEVTFGFRSTRPVRKDCPMICEDFEIARDSGISITGSESQDIVRVNWSQTLAWVIHAP